MTKSILLVALFCSTFSCASFQAAHAKAVQSEQNRLIGAAPKATDGECQSLDNQKTVWAILAGSAGVVGGAGGIGSLPVTDNGWKIAIGTSSIVVAVFGVISTVVSQNVSAEYVEKCTK